MIILSISMGAHDGAVAVSDDYEILSAVQTERLSRIKGDGVKKHLLTTIDEALRVAGKCLNDVEVLAVSRGKFRRHHFIFSVRQTLKYNFYQFIGRKKRLWLSERYMQTGVADHSKVFKAQSFIKSLGLPASVKFFDYDHHLAHAMSALFFTDYQNALIYTADGGGDAVFYSTRHLLNGKLYTFYGGEDQLAVPMPTDSIGLAYGYMTEALGYRMNRHEGKLTGLAAHGKPSIYGALKCRFFVTDSGRIATDFHSYLAMRDKIVELAANEKPEDAAASIQTLLEDLILKSMRIYIQRSGARCICVAGGVFANVALNRLLTEIPGIDKVFIFPAMGDEGLAIGGLYSYLLHRDGWAVWDQKRRPLDHLYWGGDFDSEAKALFAKYADQVERKDPVQTTAELLSEGAIVAIYKGGMEFGPRALGGRSILANPANADVNQTLNERLQRSEFMPFAPCVLEQDADDVFEISSVNRDAMKFMVTTCMVRKKWREKIPAVVHVDGTARPQIINHKYNPLYADVLNKFKVQTGLPVLVNTSFNVHEEPIVYKPEECLRALNDGRVDYVLLADGVYRKRKACF